MQDAFVASSILVSFVVVVVEFKRHGDQPVLLARALCTASAKECNEWARKGNLGGAGKRPKPWGIQTVF